MDDITFLILKVVVSVVAALIGAYLIPYLKAKTASEQLADIMALVEVAVQAAEQTIQGHGKGAEKKTEVLAYVRNWLALRGIKITDTQLDSIIEAAVLNLHMAQED